jgi:hypothetical protein
MEHFVPAADEVWRLQNRDDTECRLFQSFCEEGHYGGRDRPSSTRQGIYACTPAGTFLGSLNHNRPERVVRMLRAALEKWESLDEEARFGTEPPPERPDDLSRPEDRYPEDGLVLRVHTRDLPRKGGDAPADWRASAWNVDFAWFRADEVRALFATTAAGEPGEPHAAPAKLASRLARCHLVDNVRGQTPALDARDVEAADWTTTLESLTDDVARIRIEGRSRTVKRGRWRVEGPGEDQVRDRELGFDARLLGWAEYDAEENRVTAFEMVAAGTRWGATRYNARADDQEPAPIGVAFTLAGDSAADRVAPASIWGYGW